MQDLKKLLWSDSAVSDLDKIRKFIDKKNPKAAKNAVQVIRNACNRLVEFPNIGKPVKDLLPYRDLFIRFGASGYILRYRVYLETIYIIHIQHYREIDFNYDQRFLSSLQSVE